MAVIRLQLDVDPTLQPELHRLLTAIHDEGARAERLRQLAGTGLLWEGLRLQAAAAGRPQLEVPALGRGLESARAQAPCDLAPEAAAERLPDPAVDPAVERLSEGLAATQAPGLGPAPDFLLPSGTTAELVPWTVPVDVAGEAAPEAEIGALPAQEHAPDGAPDAPVRPGPLGPSQVSGPDVAFLREIASALQQLPVLTEVIDPAQFHAQAPKVPAAQLRRTATRSRLLRMKEKGLFRNE